MDSLAHFFTSGHAVDLILLVMSIETAAILLYRHRFGYGISAEEVLGILIPGIWLLLALRAALVGAGFRMIAVCLVAALLGHLLDLARRWEWPPNSARRLRQAQGAAKPT